MKIYDISLQIDKNLVCWQDSFYPELVMVSSIEQGAVSNNSTIKMELHTGTHIDVAYHFLQTGKKLDEYDLSGTIGQCYVCEISDGIKKIEAEHLNSLKIPPVARILFKTTNNYLYKQKNFSSDYVSLGKSGANWLLDKKVRLVGIDYLSIEAPDDKNFPVHKILLGADVMILEGLYLEKVPQGVYNLFALPLKLCGTEAAPVRAILTETD